MISNFIKEKIPFISILENSKEIKEFYLKTLCFTSILPSTFLIIINERYHFISIILYMIYILTPGLIESTGLQVSEIFSDYTLIEKVFTILKNNNRSFFSDYIFLYLVLAFLGPKIFSNFLVPHFLLLEFFIVFDFFEVLNLENVVFIRVLSYFFYFLIVLLFYMFDFLWNVLFIFSGVLILNFWIVFSFKLIDYAKKRVFLFFISDLLVTSLFCIINYYFIKGKKKKICEI